MNNVRKPNETPLLNRLYENYLFQNCCIDTQQPRLELVKIEKFDKNLQTEISLLFIIYYFLSHSKFYLIILTRYRFLSGLL